MCSSLTISPRQVAIRFTFVNEGPRDLDLILTFPLPDIDAGEYSMSPLGTTLENKDFANFPLLQNASRPSIWLHWLRLSGLTYQGRIQGTRFAHTEMLINAALQGIGIAIVPTCYIEAELAFNELHMPFGPPILSGDSYFAVHPERKAQLQSVMAFREWAMRETRSYRRPKTQ